MSVGNIIIYLFEVSVFIILLYILNKLLLGRETLHRLNRFVWLATIVVSFALPCAIWGDGSDSAELVTHQASTIIEEVPQVVATESVTTSPYLEFVVNILFALYAVGVATLFVYNIALHLSLIKIIHKIPQLSEHASSSEECLLLTQFKEYEREIGMRFKVRYIIHDSNLSPFSWFRYIVVSRKDVESSARQILLHELSHVKQLHSWDILFVNIVTIILWFNPAVWLMKRAMSQVHEYCADESVLNRGVNAKEYQLLLIKKSVGSRLYSISNTLNHSNLKNRITMMLKKKTSKMAAAKCLLSVPMLFFALLLLSSPLMAEIKDDVSDVKITKKTDTSTTNNEESDDEQPFLIVEAMPKFQGGDLKSFHRWVMGSVKYPKEAAINKITGRVIATFIVEKDGSIKEVEIVNSPDQLLSDEVIRVLKSSPKWTPAQQRGETVRIKFTLPITFSLSGSGNKQ